MRRRTLLASIAGGAGIFAGCLTDSTTADPSDVYNPTGQAVIRPLEEPYIQHGLSEDSEQYLQGRLFQSADSLAITEREGASDFSEAIDELSDDQFAILTALRTSASAPAYFWPGETRWSNNVLRIELHRQRKDPIEAGGEVVGLAITTFDYEGAFPDTVELELPSGALFLTRS